MNEFGKTRQVGPGANPEGFPDGSSGYVVEATGQIIDLSDITNEIACVVGLEGLPLGLMPEVFRSVIHRTTMLDEQNVQLLSRLEIVTEERDRLQAKVARVTEERDRLQELYGSVTLPQAYVPEPGSNTKPSADDKAEDISPTFNELVLTADQRDAAIAKLSKLRARFDAVVAVNRGLRLNIEKYRLRRRSNLSATANLVAENEANKEKNHELREALITARRRIDELEKAIRSISKTALSTLIESPSKTDPRQTFVPDAVESFVINYESLALDGQDEDDADYSTFQVLKDPEVLEDPEVPYVIYTENNEESDPIGAATITPMPWDGMHEPISAEIFEDNHVNATPMESDIKSEHIDSAFDGQANTVETGTGTRPDAESFEVPDSKYVAVVKVLRRQVKDTLMQESGNVQSQIERQAEGMVENIFIMSKTVSDLITIDPNKSQVCYTSTGELCHGCKAESKLDPVTVERTLSIMQKLYILTIATENGVIVPTFTPYGNRLLKAQAEEELRQEEIRKAKKAANS